MMKRLGIWGRDHILYLLTSIKLHHTMLPEYTRIRTAYYNAITAEFAPRPITNVSKMLATVKDTLWRAFLINIPTRTQSLILRRSPAYVRLGSYPLCQAKRDPLAAEETDRVTFENENVRKDWAAPAGRPQPFQGRESAPPCPFLRPRNAHL